MNHRLLNHSGFIEDSRYIKVHKDLLQATIYPLNKIIPSTFIIRIILQKNVLLASNLKNNHIDLIQWRLSFLTWKTSC